uniref:Nuclear condensin complex subunit 3 C-terminal domain-containing protein n=1 Tax=Trypanosoma congolense (strain IL3000) TaxID=1068625 RepID=G0UK67_TRYCI|nr:conserved hypothetical protein [Trypanosoma congolense IL3000]
MPPRKAECFSAEKVGLIFQRVLMSSVHIPQCKKELFAFYESDRAAVGEAICGAVLLVLKETPKLSVESLKRHYNFLTDFCKDCLDKLSCDQVALSIIKMVSPYHNAAEKMVRLSVVSLLEALLKTVDPTNVADERQRCYESVAEILMLRLYDKYPLVRERAACGVTYFQVGNKGCDVTQHLLILLCTDTAADVRRQILQMVRGQPEFLHGYFSSVVRCTRDVVARVRAAAWDALGVFRWESVVQSARKRKGISLSELIKDGLSDSNKAVIAACRAALTNSWLHRDEKGDCKAVVDALISEDELSTPISTYDMICMELLLSCRRRNMNTVYAISAEPVTAASVLMWKACAKVSADIEGVDESAVFIPLSQFSDLLRDKLFSSSRSKKGIESTKINDNFDFTLCQCLLSALDIYQENGYLAHSDNTTRKSLLECMTFLLKATPEEDPALYVDVAVRSLKALTERTPEDATRAIDKALMLLFGGLHLPKKHSLGYEDVEAFGRKSRERQQELAKLRMMTLSGESDGIRHQMLKNEIDIDEKFLLRMQYIVLAFLSHSERGDKITAYWSHIIQLGLRQDIDAVKVVSIKSLGMQCLVNPEAVHTFLPPILNSADEIVSESEHCVPLAALGVVFDLVMEYGFRFFDCSPRGTTGRPRRSCTMTPEALNGTEDGDALYPLGSIDAENAFNRREQHENNIAEEDFHKVGGENLLKLLRTFLTTVCAKKNKMAVVGFCKLLACSRVPHSKTPEIIADILLHHVAYRRDGKGNTGSVYMVDYLNKFFQCYASSHRNRQMLFARGGIIAFTALLRHEVPTAQWLIEFVAKCSDAIMLVDIRNIDPEAARQMGRPDDELLAEDEENMGARAYSSRHTVGRITTQSSLLSRELSRFSLHEYIASELLIEIAQNKSEKARQVCMTVLGKHMYFYAKVLPSWLLFCCDKALESVGRDSPTYAHLESWREEAVARFSVQPNAKETSAFNQRWNDTIDVRNAVVAQLVGCPFARMLCNIAGGCEEPGAFSTDPSYGVSGRKRGRDIDATSQILPSGDRRRKGN